MRRPSLCDAYRNPNALEDRSSVAGPPTHRALRLSQPSEASALSLSLPYLPNPRSHRANLPHPPLCPNLNTRPPHRNLASDPHSRGIEYPTPPLPSHAVFFSNPFDDVDRSIKEGPGHLPAASPGKYSISTCALQQRIPFIVSKSVPTLR